MASTEDDLLARIGITEFPAMGDARKRYTVELTEPEINALAGSYGFIKGACQHAGFRRWWDHYGEALESIAAKLEVFEDGNAPYVEP